MTTFKSSATGLLSILIVCFSAVSAAALNLPRTGQTTCYDNTVFGHPPIHCAGTGQDGELQAGVDLLSPRFTDNGNGTITDNRTGLMWLQNGQLFGAGSRMEWSDALYNANRLNSGILGYCGGAPCNAGYNDWRIPNVYELESLVNYGAADTSAWLNTQGFFNVQSGPWYYWSSTTDISTGGSSLGWAVRLSDGLAYTLPKSGTADGRQHFWVVRGGSLNGTADQNVIADVPRTGQTVSYASGYSNGDDGDYQAGVAWPAQRFVPNTNGTPADTSDDTFTDTLTSLTWLADPNCMATQYGDFDQDWTHRDGAVTWRRALDFVAAINNGQLPNCSAGHNDWRLPNIRELRSLADHSQTRGGTALFWSSTTMIADPTQAYAMDLYQGRPTTSTKDIALAQSLYFVWPVRGGAAGTPGDQDNDGMPDVFETAFYLNPNLNDAAADPDGDGRTNIEEYRNNTNPMGLCRDMNNNGRQELDDVILALQLMTGGTVTVDIRADCNDDRQVGMMEALHALKAVVAAP